jgi:hypothetical protein
MGRLFRKYNLVLWQTFSYCRRCQGGCCVAGASQVTVFDALALALLDEPFPDLPSRAAAEDCIYLGAQGCRWPQTWRPIKCWSVYCLGSGDWELDAADVRYQEITAALGDVVRRWLPGRLRTAEADGPSPYVAFLSDPISFAESIGATLFDLFVEPFAANYDLGGAHRGVQPYQAFGASLNPPADEAILSFIAETGEALWEQSMGGDAAAADRLLADLEHLEWLLVNRPATMQEALHELAQRYDPGDGDGPGSADVKQARRRMAGVLKQLLQDSAS